jgi:hypothetical protein
MTACENGTGRELFKAVSENQIRLAFVIFPDDRWAITRDGERVALGTVDRSSLQAGVEQFATLTHPATEASACAACDPVVQSHLDRIESPIPLGASGKGRRRRVRRSVK